VGRPRKGQKTKKVKNSSLSAFVGTRGRDTSPSAKEGALGEEVPSPSASRRLSGKRSPSASARVCTREDFFSFFGKRLCPMLPSNANFFLRVSLFPSVALGEDGFPRVPPFPECNTRGRFACRFLKLGEEFGTRGISVLP
jgi:hypothetical protein